ncbi:MAG TPA: nucleotide pyrophosphohydrolase [Candidatus Dormibacteraeota bacterium]|jgi:NTP pyrophosphatase (non-canonical NTP hydrolase)|nr:nucleotide pyrophosphohydrolase [Candidatus Dormibacteraeota bacterium]
MDVTRIQERLRRFSAERDWDGFLTPKNLAMALAVESGELLEVFQWLTAEESSAPDPDTRRRAVEEMADVQIYLLRLADRLGVDMEEAVLRKIEAAARKYPAPEPRGD